MKHSNNSPRHFRQDPPPAPRGNNRTAPPQAAHGYNRATPQAAYGYRAPVQPQKSKKPGRAVVIIILLIFIIGFAVGAFMLARTLYHAAKEQKTFDSLAEMIEDTDEVNEDGTLRKYDALYNKNPDFFGWLKIEGTKIDYPVMYKPSDPEYYLHRDFYGNYSDSGMLFIDGDCPAKGNYYLIYGHHMHNGSMFGQLSKYEKIEYYQKHKTIFFDTRYELRDYEVVAAFRAQVYDVRDEAGKFCYYNYKDLSSPDDFNEYVANIKAYSLYETGITPTFGDELITLSTCNYHTQNGRFVVVARRVNNTTPAQ